MLRDRYVLVEVVGQGATSLVWRARDTRMGRDVAIKMLTVGADEKRRAELVAEASVAGQLQHPHVVTVLDVVDDPQEPFIVMEFAGASSLATRLTAQGRLPPGEAIDVTSQVLDALDRAHQAGFVHRDVKPSNILINDDGVAKLADFGIAEPIGGQRARPADIIEVVGTAQYLAPELARGEPATPASDLYAVGVMLYEILSGQLPFDGDDATAVALAHARSEVPSLRERAPDLSPALTEVVDRALNKRPAARFSDAAAMRRALSVKTAAPRTQVLALPVTEQFTAAGAETGPQPRKEWRLAVAALATAFAAAALLVVIQPSPSDGPAAQAAGPLSSDSVTTTSVPEAVVPTESSRPLPLAATDVPSVREVYDGVAQSPKAVGEKGPELLKRLQSILEATGEDRADQAEEVIDKIDEWSEEEKLDWSTARTATRSLEELLER